jgi:hypothetical protein
LDPNDPETTRVKNEVVEMDDFLAAHDLTRETVPASVPVFKVVPLKIEYTEDALMLEGYSRKQVWEP